MLHWHFYGYRCIPEIVTVSAVLAGGHTSQIYPGSSQQPAAEPPRIDGMSLWSVGRRNRPVFGVLPYNIA